MARPTPPRFLGAATDPWALAVLGTGGVAAAAMQSFPALALGGIAYVALVAWEWTAPFRATSTAPTRPDLPEPAAFADASVRAAVTSLHQARAELDKVLGDAPAAITRHLEVPLRGVRELEAHALVMAGRAEELNDFLKTQDRGQIASDAQRLDRLSKETRDVNARSEFAEAIAARGDQLRTLDDIQSAKDRALANLAKVVTTLEALPPRVVRMRTLDDRALDTLGRDVEEDLGALNAEIRVFEDTLKTLATEGLT